MSALINIRSYRLDAVHVALREDYDPARPAMCQVEVQFAVASIQVNSFVVRLISRFHTEMSDQQVANLPYDVRLGIVGQFDTPVEIDPTAIPAPFALNALMILYGVIRGIIGQLTSTFLHGEFVIPTVAFDSVVEKAANDPKTIVAQVPDRPVVGDPMVREYIGFELAIEDFARFAPDISDGGLRERVLRAWEAFIKDMSAFPTSKDITGASARLSEVGSALEESTEPLSTVLTVHLGRIRAALTTMEKHSASQEPKGHG